MKPRHFIPALLLTLVFVAYPLSIGPVNDWAQHHPEAYPWMDKLYRPLGFIYDHCPVVRPVCNAYFMYWNGRAN